MRPLRRLAIGIFCIVFGACSGHVTPIVPIPSSPNPAPAHAIVQLGVNTGVKPGLNVLMSVGGTPARRFLLDTGSAGFWVYPHAIGRYTATRYAVMNSYGSGLMYEGVLAYTTVDFGNGLVTRKMPVALVQRATCVPGATTCPATPNQQNCPAVKPGPNAGIRCLEVGRKLFGTFGAALATFPSLRQSQSPSCTTFCLESASRGRPLSWLRLRQSKSARTRQTDSRWCA